MSSVRSERRALPSGSNAGRRSAKAQTHARTPAAPSDVAPAAVPDDVADGGDDPGDHVDSADSGGGWSWDDD